MSKSLFLLAVGTLIAVNLDARAQTQNSISKAIPTKNEANLKAARPTVSLAAILQLQDNQIARLNRVYDDLAARRSKQETTLAQLQNGLQSAQSPTAFDEKKASRSMREITQLQQKISADFLSARAKSLQVLEPVQRAQLESLASDPRFSVRNDQFSRLLLLPSEQFGKVRSGADFRFENAPNRSSRAPRRRGYGGGTATYGVYGGYGYGGPDVGVRAGYGRGPVGVNIGVGRGGPRIGIGIGGILGGRWR